ncbi:MAG: MCE family protein [Alphaproteobacteria bacterium]|nr:MCE family protein [Alphaproteobacteria bacterium]
METKANYALIGAFVLLAVVTIVGFVLWLGASQLNRDFAEYDVVFQGPVTLEEGASVRYIGIKVGEVESVRIDSRDTSKVRARLRIDRNTPVKTDSTAVIDFAGITGVTFVQITAGSETASRLTVRPYEDVPVITAGPTPLAELFVGGTEIIGQAGITLQKAGDLLTEENIAAVSQTLENLDTITSAIAADDAAIITQAYETLAALEQAGDRVTVAADQVSAAAGSVDRELVDLNVELKRLVSELNTATSEAATTLVQSQEALDAASVLIRGSATDTMVQAGLAAQDLRSLATRLDRVMRMLEQNPQSLVVGKPLPYEEERR